MILYEKYTHHQQYIYHVFIDFKKSFYCVRHEALWATLNNYNIYHDILRSIEGVYKSSTSAVYKNGAIGDCFDTSVGVRQGCLLSPTLFNIFLERIMTEALECYIVTVSIGGRSITYIIFAHDIDITSSEEELLQLVERLENTSIDYVI